MIRVYIRRFVQHVKPQLEFIQIVAVLRAEDFLLVVRLKVSTMDFSLVSYIQASFGQTQLGKWPRM